jgi:outer membrane protein insertion porin family
LKLDTSLYRTVDDFLSLDALYDVAHTGAKVGLTRALGSEFLLGTVSYNIDQVDILDINTNAPDAILTQGGHTLLNRFGVGISYDTRNDVELPNHGTLTSLSSVLTVGSDSSWVKTELSSGWYFRGFFPGNVLEVVGKAGVAQPLGSEDVPFYDRYYLGGPQTLRGYDYTAVGPRAPTQDGNTYEPIGGDTYWLGSVEYSVPIVDHLRFALFYDIGNLSEKPWHNGGYTVIGRPNDPLVGTVLGSQTQNYPGNTGNYSDNYGFGIRLNIPHLGPLRLDYGIPLHHDPFSGNTGKFNFSAGFTRPL